MKMSSLVKLYNYAWQKLTINEKVKWSESAV